MRKYLLLSTFYIFSTQIYALYKTELKTNWLFRQVGDVNWLAAQVPGNLYTDLLLNKKIQDSSKPNNLAASITQSAWEYETTFTISSYHLKYEHINILFEGLDTYADVFLNDSLILHNDNMFVPVEMRLKPFLKKGTNRLRIVFGALNQVISQAYRTFSANTSSVDSLLLCALSPCLRKAAYQFASPFVLSKVSVGIWKPIRLLMWNDVRLLNIHLQQLALSDTKAELLAKIEVESTYAQHATLSIQNSILKEVDLEEGVQVIEIPFEIANPERWWTHDLGTPYVYSLNFKVTTTDEEDIRSERIGLRTLEVLEQQGQLQVKLNGKKIFLKGAVWLPTDILTPHADKDKYRRLFADMVTSNFNIIRVWGGGVYESNDFYRLANENGILVWQDLMFTDTNYPTDTLFVNNVRKELDYQIKRLRNHPSIAMWSVNGVAYNSAADEMLMSEYSPTDMKCFAFMNTMKDKTLMNNMFGHSISSLKNKFCSNETVDSSYVQCQQLKHKLFPSNQTLFDVVIPGMIHNLDSGRLCLHGTKSPSAHALEEAVIKKRPFIEGNETPMSNTLTKKNDNVVMGSSSPLKNKLTDEISVSHILSQRHDNAAKNSSSKNNLFSDEDAMLKSSDVSGSNSPFFPSLSMPDSVAFDRDIHQWQQSYMTSLLADIRQYYPIIDSIDTQRLSYFSQLLQAERLKTFIEYNRRKQPFTTGIIYSHFNDYTFTISHSTIDSHERWKAAQYFVKKAYSPLLVHAICQNDTIKISLVSDKFIPVEGTLYLKLIDVEGNVLWQKDALYDINPAMNFTVFVAKTSFLKKDMDKKKCFLTAELWVDNEQVSQNILYFTSPKALLLPKTVIDTDVLSENDRIVIKLRSKTLAKNVCLKMGNTASYHFSDNFFDLLPQQEVKIWLKTSLSLAEVKKNLTVICVND